MLRARFIPIVLSLLLPLPADLASQASTRATILRLEEEWGKALVARDAKRFGALLAPGFIYTENERVYTREELIREATGGSDTVTSFLNEDLQVMVRGNTAVVIGWLTLRGRGATGPFDRKFRFTDTWVRANGRWRVLAAHDYLMPSQ